MEDETKQNEIKPNKSEQKYQNNDKNGMWHGGLGTFSIEEKYLMGNHSIQDSMFIFLRSSFRCVQSFIPLTNLILFLTQFHFVHTFSSATTNETKAPENEKECHQVMVLTEIPFNRNK